MSRVVFRSYEVLDKILKIEVGYEFLFVLEFQRFLEQYRLLLLLFIVNRNQMENFYFIIEFDLVYKGMKFFCEFFVGYFLQFYKMQMGKEYN